MISSGIRILMRSPRKPIKNSTFSGCSRGLDSMMMMSSCLFTNAMSDPLLNMLMLLGLPLSLRNRGKFWNTCKKRACRTTLGQRYTTYAAALETCGLESLAERREGHCRGFADGLANSERTNNLLPPTRWESHARNLRNASNNSQLRIKASRFKNSPIPYFINLSNQ